MKSILKKLFKMKKTIIILSILTISIFITAPVFAGIIPTPPDSTPPDSTSINSQSTSLNITNPLGGTNDISTLVSNIINFLIILAVPITAILIVYAGFLYITSAGNDEKVKTAQKALIWAIIGFAIVLVASSVPIIIEKFLSGETEESEELGQSNDSDPGIPSIDSSPHDSDDVFIID